MWISVIVIGQLVTRISCQIPFQWHYKFGWFILAFRASSGAQVHWTVKFSIASKSFCNTNSPRTASERWNSLLEHTWLIRMQWQCTKRIRISVFPILMCSYSGARNQLVLYVSCLVHRFATLQCTCIVMSHVLVSVWRGVFQVHMYRDQPDHGD